MVTFGPSPPLHHRRSVSRPPSSGFFFFSSSVSRCVSVPVLELKGEGGGGIGDELNVTLTAVLWQSIGRYPAIFGAS